MSKVRYESISKLYGDTLSTGCKYDQLMTKMQQQYSTSGIKAKAIMGLELSNKQTTLTYWVKWLVRSVFSSVQQHPLP